MSAHVLLNLLSELGKRDKMRGLPSILSLFRNEWGKEIKCEACRAFYLFFATSLINSIKQEHEC